jgi:aspartyl-tRNA synthetase
MVLANQDSIRDVLLFPTLRPIKAEGAMEMKPVQIEGQGTTTPAKK